MSLIAMATDSSPEPQSHLWLWRVVTGVAVVALWWLLVESAVLPRSAFGEPSAVLSWMGGWVASGDAFGHISMTVQAALYGYIAGLTAGAIVAVVFVFIPGVALVFEPFMAVLNSVPRIIVAPLFLLFLGTGIASKVAVAALIVFFIAFFNLYNGLRSVDRNIVDQARVLGGRPWHLARHIYVPAVVSWILSTLRVGVGFAMVGAVVAEFVGSNQGVGYIMNLGRQLGDSRMVMGGLIALGLVAAVMDWAFNRVELRYTRWRVF